MKGIEGAAQALRELGYLKKGQWGHGEQMVYPKEEGLFWISGNNQGLACPFKPITCEVGYCRQCQIYLDWEKLGELIHICAWCSKVIDRKPSVGRPVISHGICPECKRKYFGIEARG